MLASVVIAVLFAGITASSTKAHYVSKPAAQVKHGSDVLRFFKNHPHLARTPAARVAIRNHTWLLHHGQHLLIIGEAWQWYLSKDTQCVTNHEGGWTSVNPVGYYGRFQMDIPFQNETTYGRWAYDTWGTAEKWPPIVQVTHAHEVWSYAGWSRWPTYYLYCA